MDHANDRLDPLALGKASSKKPFSKHDFVSTALLKNADAANVKRQRNDLL